MEYQIEKIRKERKKSRKALVQLYLNSKTWAEFKIAADVEVPEASSNDMRACKLHYLKKTHPFAYCIACYLPLVCSALSFFTAIALEGTTACCFGWATTAFMGSWLAGGMMHLALHGNMMDKLGAFEREI